MIYPAARRGRKVAYLTLASFAFLVVVVLVLTLLAAACTSSDDEGGDAAGTDSASSTTAADSTAAPSTTEADSTTTAPTTTLGPLTASFRGVTEDTIRAAPGDLRQLFEAAIDAGASRLCLCDTVGAAVPWAVANLVSWTCGVLEELGVSDRVGIDWHGHRDRGLDLANTLAALEAGATRVHGTALGVGERVGNTPIEQLLETTVERLRPSGRVPEGLECKRPVGPAAESDR